MLNTIKPRAAQVGDAVLTASRQVWLAGLGTAVVTRDWAEKEGGTVFRTLVREGTAVESKAVRFVGDRLETSFTQANTIWKRARRTVTTTVKTYADTAAMLVRETLPASLPKVSVAPARVKQVATRKPVKAKAPAAAKSVKRARKAVAKRA